MQQQTINNTPQRSFFGHPWPLQPLFFTEVWERFSYYGIRPLLILFMAAAINEGGLGLPREQAAAIVGIFGGCVYLSSLPGGWLADNYFGQGRAVWYGCVLIALGHLSIATSALWGANMFYIGLVLLVLGSGLFKTCISVMVGTLYKEGDPKRDAGFSIFYMAVNIGSLIAPLITGYFAEQKYWHLALGIGGLGMLIALLIFRLWAVPAMIRFDQAHHQHSSWSRPVAPKQGVAKWICLFLVGLTAVIVMALTGFIHIDALAVARVLVYVTAIAVGLYFIGLLVFSAKNLNERARLIVCLILLAAAALFWSAFEQEPTAFNLFAVDHTDRNIGGFVIPAVWFQSINPLVIIALAPFFAWLWPTLGRKNLNPGTLGKFAIALLLSTVGFLLMRFAAQSVLDMNGQKVSAFWLTATITLLTLGELCLSPVGLSAITALSPARMRGQMMGLWFCASAFGNIVAGLIGGQVSADNLESLPELFGRVSMALGAGALILLILILPIKKLIAKGEATQ